MVFRTLFVTFVDSYGDYWALSSGITHLFLNILARDSFSGRLKVTILSKSGESENWPIHRQESHLREDRPDPGLYAASGSTKVTRGDIPGLFLVQK